MCSHQHTSRLSHSDCIYIMKFSAVAVQAGLILSCAWKPTLCPRSWTVFQSWRHSRRNQKLPVWPLSTPCYRLTGFPATLKGLCGAENVINKREWGRPRDVFNWGERRGKERGLGPFTESVMMRSGATVGHQLCYHVGNEWRLTRDRTALCVVSCKQSNLDQFVRSFANKEGHSWTSSQWGSPPALIKHGLQNGV